MAKKSKKSKSSSNTIVVNKKARHDYFIEQSLEAGLSLEGWEVKSLRDNKVHIKESYVILKNNELFLFGAHITPMKNASTHVNPDPTRTRKLLLNRLEINRIKDKVNQKGVEESMRSVKSAASKAAEYKKTVLATVGAGTALYLGKRLLIK